jgi:hypothetical protein
VALNVSRFEFFDEDVPKNQETTAEQNRENISNFRVFARTIATNPEPDSDTAARCSVQGRRGQGQGAHPGRTLHYRFYEAIVGVGRPARPARLSLLSHVSPLR